MESNRFVFPTTLMVGNSIERFVAHYSPHRYHGTLKSYPPRRSTSYTANPFRSNVDGLNKTR